MKRADPFFYGLYAEALLALSLASLAKAILPFRMLARFASRPLSPPRGSGEPISRTAPHVRRAVLGWARRLPWRPKCLPQGIAAQYLLRRRGIPAVLCFGAKRDAAGGYVAHAWVHVGDFDVVGGDVAKEFALLAEFPPSPARPDAEAP